MALKTNILLKRHYLNRGVKNLNFNLKFNKNISNLKIKKILNNFLRRMNFIPLQIQTKSTNFNLINR